MTATLQIQTAEVFKPLLNPSRYKGAHGGRGSGKSHFFGGLLVEDSLCEKGLLSVCIREVQKTLKDSSKRLIEKKIQEMGVGHEFKVWNDRIETPGDGVIIFQGMQDHTAESIKSLEGFRRAWMEEAQTISTRSLTLLRPTIFRNAGSEIWASWNPRRKVDAVDEFFRGEGGAPASSIVVESNWRDNPWFGADMELERKLDLERYPERYEHIWEGGYAKAFEGAYYARQLAAAKLEGRICAINPDPLLPVQAVFDIGGSGAQADAMTVWIHQNVGPQIRILDYIEARGQALEYYVNELKSRGWGKAIIRLPHDGLNANAVTGKRYVDHWRDAGFDAPEPTPNQGRGAANHRIEAARRIFPNCWFNNTPAVEAGLDALGFYHERKDTTRNIGLGPEHDWSSHGADSFGLLAIIYEAPYAPTPRTRYSSRRASTGGSWESA